MKRSQHNMMRSDRPLWHAAKIKDVMRLMISSLMMWMHIKGLQIIIKTTTQVKKQRNTQGFFTFYRNGRSKSGSESRRH